MAVLDDLRESMAPISTPDLDTYLQAIASMFSEVELYSLATDDATDDAPGWGVLFDVDLCPVNALPYLAQLVGETLATTLTEDEARRQIRTQPNRRRGTRDGIIAAARATLSDPDDATVVFIERSSSASPSEPAYGLTVGTLSAETPDPTATEAAIRANLPGGILLEYIVSDGPVINEGTATINASTNTIDFAQLADVT